VRKGLDDLLTVQEAAQLKEVDETSVRRAIGTGKLKGQRKSRIYLIQRRELEAWTPERRGRKRQPPAGG
jgi:excisionase family DNA binding protein